MHPSALVSGQKFFETYWQPGMETILDVGSMNVNGTLRSFAPPGAKFYGIDLMPGDGVDAVLDDPYKYPFADGSIDMVISTSCLEHDQFFWLTFLEMARVVSPEGFIYLNAPSRTNYHHAPDHWRFYPDAAVALTKWAARNAVEIHMVETFLLAVQEEPNGAIVNNPHWDNVMIFTKRPAFRPARYLCNEVFGAVWVRRGAEGILEQRGRDF